MFLDLDTDQIHMEQRPFTFFKTNLLLNIKLSELFDNDLTAQMYLHTSLLNAPDNSDYFS